MDALRPILPTALAVWCALTVAAPEGLAGPCECREGPCCDGCHFLGTERVCAVPGGEELHCSAERCGAEVLRRQAPRHCSGHSSGCDGELGEFGPWKEVTRCSQGEVCEPSLPACRPSPDCRCWERCDDGDPLTRDRCTATGACEHVPIACDDHDPCTTDEFLCGGCVHGAPYCNDRNPCTRDRCEAFVGCRHEPVLGGTCLAPDGRTGICYDSRCCVPDCDGRACGDDGCGGFCGPHDGRCDDGDGCTADRCDDGVCVHRPHPVDDGVVCTLDACQDGVISHTLSDAACDDGLTCSWDVCTETGCVHDTDACSCSDDDYEDNDTRHAAVEVSPGLAEPSSLPDLAVNYGDDDWWTFDVVAGSRIKVVLRTPESDPGLGTDLHIRVADGWEHAFVVQPVPYGAVVEGVAAVTGPATVHLWTPIPGLCFTYELELEVLPPADSQPVCNVPCPYLDRYDDVYCNAQNHCEYTRSEPEAWEETDVLIWVPPGSFPFGTPDQEIIVTFANGYWIDKYEVSAGAYRAYVEELGTFRCPDELHDDFVWCVMEHCWISGNGWLETELCTLIWHDEVEELVIPHRCSAEWNGPITSCESHPVGDVPWMAARAFCQWQGRDLCSESQWERAGKGTEQRTYPWGDAPVPYESDWDGSLAHPAFYSGTPFHEGRWAPVDSFPAGASPVGCHHMAGNMDEWVLDTAAPYDDDERQAAMPRDGSPCLAGDPDGRTARGSAGFPPWDPNPWRPLTDRFGWDVRTVWNSPPEPDPPRFEVNAWSNTREHVGFRCCRTPSHKE